MEKCSVGTILSLACGLGRYDEVYTKIEIDDLPITHRELLRIRTKITTLNDVTDVCSKHKSQFIDNFSNLHRYKCVDPFKVHKAFAKKNLHEVTLAEFHNIFQAHNVLPGQRVCMKCLKKCKDNVDDTIPPTDDEIEQNVEMEDEEMSTETALDIVDKSLELFDCSPMKTVKADRTINKGNRKINHVTDAFTKVISIALDEPTLGKSTDCSSCSRLVELIKEKLANTENRTEIIQLLTIVPCDFSVAKVVEVFKVSQNAAKQARKLRLEKGILSTPDRKERVGISQETKECVVCFYQSDDISRLMPGKKDCVTIKLPDRTKEKRQKRLILSNIKEIYSQFKKENPDRKIGFSTFALLRPKWCIPVGAAGTHNVCVCTYHQNVKLMLVAMNSSQNYREIMKLCVCDVEN